MLRSGHCKIFTFSLKLLIVNKKKGEISGSCSVERGEDLSVARIQKLPLARKKVRSVNCSGLDSVRMGLATPDPSTKVKLLLILVTLHDARMIFDSSIV